MTPEEWLISEDPQAMLTFLRGPPLHEGANWPPSVEARKLRLFAAACCRQVWNKLTDDASCGECSGGVINTMRMACPRCKGAGRINRSRRAVEVAEKFADGLATEGELYEASEQASLAGEIHSLSYVPVWASRGTISSGLNELLRAEHRGWKREDRPIQAALLRDVAGNPFRPAYRGRGTMFTEEGAPILWERHITPTVVSLAQAAYSGERGRGCGRCGATGCPYCGGPEVDYHTMCADCPDCQGSGRIEDGSLDPLTLAAVADALEEVGCDSEDLLRHLRGEERCFKCGGTGRGGDNYLDRAGGGLVTCNVCLSSGWIRLRGPHVRGCFAIDAILNQE